MKYDETWILMVKKLRCPWHPPKCNYLGKQPQAALTHPPKRICLGKRECEDDSPS